MSVWLIIGLAFAFVVGNFMALRYTSNMKFKQPPTKQKPIAKHSAKADTDDTNS